jgi:hypothetical protein
MGRRNRRAEQATPLRVPPALMPAQELPDGAWHVRTITGAAATKTYRCPGCQQEIGPGTPHVVAWRADRPDGGDWRRHWHTPCWQRRDTRPR